jgi:hypothetical protein
MKTYEEHKKAVTEGWENLFGEPLIQASVIHDGKSITLKLDRGEGRYYMNDSSLFYEKEAIGRILDKAASNGASIDKTWGKVE